MSEFLSFLKKLRPEHPANQNRQASLRQRFEAVLLTDNLSEEIKEMIENNSGCGFVSILRVLRHLDSPVLKTTEAQKKLINEFKKMFGSLFADMVPADIVKFCTSYDLGIHITTFYYDFNLGTKDQITDHLSFQGTTPLNFNLVPFRPGVMKLVLEPSQVAIIGLTSDTDDTGHYICSDRGDIFQPVNAGGDTELRQYIQNGYRATEIFVFEKKGTR